MTLPDDVLEPLTLALQSDGGEVVVTDAVAVGRLFVCKRAIAWVVCEQRAMRLSDLLVTEFGLERAELDAVVTESRTKGLHFGETLLLWGLLDETRLRRAMLMHNALHLKAIVELRRPRSALFLPQPRQYKGSLLFSLDEIIEAMHSAPTPKTEVPFFPTPVPFHSPSTLAERRRQALLSIPHCRAAGWVDARLQTTSTSTQQLTADQRALLFEVVKTLVDSTSGETEAIEVRDELALVAQLASSGTSIWFAFIVHADDTNKVSLALARSTLRSIAGVWVES